MQKTAQKVDLTYLAVFIASAAGSGLSLLAALLFGGSGLFSLVARQMEPHAMLGLSGGMLLISLICLPGLVLSFLHLNGRPLPAWPVLRFPAGMAALAILVLFVVAIFIGTFTSTVNLGAFIFPLAVMLAAVLPPLFTSSSARAASACPAPCAAPPARCSASRRSCRWPLPSRWSCSCWRCCWSASACRPSPAC